MAHEIIMPKAGMSMESGVIVAWLKSIGDYVEAGEPLLEIESDKVNMEVEAETSGYLISILRQEGETVPVVETIGYLGEKGEAPPAGQPSVADAPSAPAAAATPASPDTPEAPAPPATADEPAPAGTGIRATPAARRLAREAGVPLEAVTPAADGVIYRETVAAGSAGARGPDSSRALEEGDTSTALAGVRKVIAHRMTESHLTAPPVTLFSRVDVTRLIRDRATISDQAGTKVTVGDLVVRGVSLSLPDHPAMRTHLVGDRLTTYHSVDLGVAVATGKGLLVPVLRGADRLSLSALTVALHELIEQTRTGTVAGEDLTGGVFTITNLGMYGIESFTAILNAPESGILGVGTVVEELYLEEASGTPTQRSVMKLSLTLDHRVADGADGARFLQDLRTRLEDPESLG